jgi:hypothetical protein
MTTDTDTERAVATREQDGIATREAAGIASLNHVLGSGNLAALSNTERVGHYLRLCRSLGLNPLSRPFDWIEFDGKLALYPNQSCAAQLRRQHQIRIEVTRREPVGEMFVVEVKGTTPDGREDFASKYVPLLDVRGNRLAGQHYANALMKAETGAKRRLTFSMVGLAVPPDPEEATVGWKPVIVDGSGMILRHPSPEQRYLAEQPAAAKAIGEPVFEDTAVEDALDVSQAVRPEELERPKRPAGPRPTFRPTKEQVDRLCGAWFAATTGSSLGSDDARHDFVRDWTRTEAWPAGKQTQSLREFFARATEREAGDFLAHVRALVLAERQEQQRAAEEALAEARGEAIPTEAAHDEEPF